MGVFDLGFIHGLKEINLYPYLTWAFYGTLFFLSSFWLKTEKRLYTLFLITLIFETAFVIDIGFFVRPSYIVGLILVVRTAARRITFPARHSILLVLFVFAGIVGVFLNLDLIGAASSGESRATFLRPVIQLGQLITMILITASVFTTLQRGQYFRHTVRVLHWLSVAVAISALYELLAIYFSLPYLNLNNMLPEYWYPGFGIALGSNPDFSVFRARVTFIEPIELNNFQMLGIASSLVYRIMYQKPWRYYAPFLLLQVLVLFGTFSRSTLLTLAVLAPVFLFFYPQRAQSALGLLVKRGVSIAVVALFIFAIHYGATVTPEELKQSNTVTRILLTRIVLHQSQSDKLSIFGRAGAIKEMQSLTDEGRLAFGVGIGNDANFWGGIGGSNSLYDQIVLYTGIIGISLFLVFVGLILFGLFRNYMRRSSHVVFRKIYWIFCIGLLGMLVQRLSFSGLLTDTYLWVAFALCIYLGQRQRSSDIVKFS